MGHGSSKEDGSSCSSDEDAKPSRISRVKQRLRRHRLRRRRGSDSSHKKLFAAEDFAGIAHLTLINAEMKFKDKWLACVSFGEQTFRTNVSNETDKPVWNCERKLLLEKTGPRVARISVFETNRLSKNNLIGYCEINLLDYLTQDSDSDFGTFDLIDPGSSDKVVGCVCISCNVEDPIETEKNFARRILSVVDYDEDGKLSLSEFSELINAFGNNLAASKKEELFKAADKNGDGVVSLDELAELLALQQETQEIYDFYILYTVSVKKTLRRFPKLILISSAFSMLFCVMLNPCAKEILQSISERQGRQMNTAESAKEIPKFVEFFKDQINMAEVKYPLEHFKYCFSPRTLSIPPTASRTFNEFFVRELKPGARTIASIERDDVAVCAADCRLMAFKSVEDSLRFWVKGRKFSIQGLLGKEVCSNAFIDGSLVIFRLAPQDYHRFHLPVSGTIVKFVNIPGCLYTVNPIAVNSKYCNVFTENKRVVTIISTAKFGKVAFVAIGATMVGSITFVKKEGDFVKKGEELGYFSFGGSTVICVFEKGAIDIDDDLLANSGRSLETLVSVGMTLGVSKKKPGSEGLPNLENCVLRN
ncbi:hypothetical protein GOBAR_DD22480 [Gossypium barbadense]|nr:hypothetical protein GOBAR_DD22480 [Gossypium barbadense]